MTRVMKFVSYALLLFIAGVSLASCHTIDNIIDDDEEIKQIRNVNLDNWADNNFPHGVPLQGFYKDVFMDAGVYLTTRYSLPAVDHLGLSLESVSCTDILDTLWQNTIISGEEIDLNGRLLYPDGQPRYKIIYVCGGNSRTHGKSLRTTSLDRMRDFVNNGGSYLGTCAGAFFASNGYDDYPDYPYYLNLWPGMMHHTGLTASRTGLFINPDSPLLNYYDFGGDNYVSDVRHNKGGYASVWPEGTELLARYDYPDIPTMHEQPAAWAYKPSPKSGRIIQEGSHPEEVGSGERRDLTAAMIRYAIDGLGETTIKGLLTCDQPWIMDKSTLDADPLHTMIGDLQYHHFAVYVPYGSSDLKITLTSPTDCDLQLAVSFHTYAYSDVADFVSDSKGPNQEYFIHKPISGLWFISVRCLTTVIAKDTELGLEYSGRTDVLNGVPYTILATWD